ncbi:MAG: family 78 glycoside hydrolase catalytic domain [Oscillospiraceae bacterium]|nr:family 78 glycoside hydrolase catalytic domain [Oscillospiraceae bacterium]
MSWIWTDNNPDVINAYAEFLQEFDHAGEKAILNISAADKYAVWVNGAFAGCGQYDDCSSYKIYDTIDISGYCKHGKNHLLIMVYYQGINCANCVRSEPKLWFSLKCGNRFYHSSTDTLARKVAAYTSGEIEHISPQLGFTFYYDARLEDGGEWLPAHCIECSIVPIPRPIKRLNVLPAAAGKILNQGVFLSDKAADQKSAAEMMYTDLIAPRYAEEFISFKPKFSNVQKYAAYQFDLPCDGYTFPNSDGYDGVYMIIDLGRELAGFPFIEIEAEEGAVFDIAYGEHLDDGRVRSYVGERNFAFRYVAKEGKQSFAYYFKRCTGRYLELHARTSKPFTLYHLSIMHAEYPLKIMPYPETLRDSLQKKIYDISVDTLRLCMHEHYEDCPWREQALYAMDARNQALAGYYAFGEYDFPYASWKLFEPFMRSDGMFPLTVPSENKKTIPSFNLAWVIACEELVTYGGEKYNTFGPSIRKMLDSFAAKAENGILSSFEGAQYWNFFEWADGLAGRNNVSETPKKSAALTLFFYAALRSYKRIFDDGRYEKVTKDIEDNFHKVFWSKDNSAYCTFAGERHFAELVQALALWCELVPSAIAPRLRCELANDENPWVKVTISHFIYKIDALMLEPEKYYDYINQQIMKLWSKMVYAGSTTFWETIDGGDAFYKAGSLCHGWSATPIYFWHKYSAYSPR